MKLKDLHRSILLAACLPCVALAIPEEMAPKTPGAAGGQPAALADDLKARLAYNLGLEIATQAKQDEAAAQRLSGGKHTQAMKKVQDQYKQAQAKFAESAAADPQLAAAWNMLGFTTRKLGDYPQALAAYDKALALNPAYPEAIEYRAEAFLALDRLEEAKAAYLALFSEARPVANELLLAMHGWVERRRREPGALAPAQIDEFSKWVSEQSARAEQTAALVTGTPATRWH